MDYVEIKSGDTVVRKYVENPHRKFSLEWWNAWWFHRGSALGAAIENAIEINATENWQEHFAVLAAAIEKVGFNREFCIALERAVAAQSVGDSEQCQSVDAIRSLLRAADQLCAVYRGDDPIAEPNNSAAIRAKLGTVADR